MQEISWQCRRSLLLQSDSAVDRTKLVSKEIQVTQPVQELKGNCVVVNGKVRKGRKSWQICNH